MNDERNALLEQFFAEAVQDCDAEAFVASVMARATKLRTRRLIFLVAAGLALVPAIWLVSTPLNDIVESLTQFVSRPIIAGGSENLILAPLNSFASLLGLGLLGLLAIHRWLFS